jgi:hypothetical protein
MNTRIALSALVLAAGFSGAAFAESPGPQSFPFTSGRTVGEVQAEYHQYRAAGVNPWSTTYNPLRQFKSSTTREAVVADYLGSREQVRAIHGEDGGSFHFAAQRQLPGAAPAPVLADALNAR